MGRETGDEEILETGAASPLVQAERSVTGLRMAPAPIDFVPAVSPALSVFAPAVVVVPSVAALVVTPVVAPNLNPPFVGMAGCQDHELSSPRRGAAIRMHIWTQ